MESKEFRFTGPVYHDGVQYQEGDAVSARTLHAFLNDLLLGGWVEPVTRLERPAPPSKEGK